MNPAPRRASTDRPAGKSRSSWLRRLFGWFWSGRSAHDEAVRASDAYFASIGAGPAKVLGASSGLPPSPLAAAYAASANTGPPATSQPAPPAAPQWKIL